jgi:hypothetical protein
MAEPNRPLEVTGPEYVRPDQRSSEGGPSLEVSGPAYLRPGERAPEPAAPATPPLTREEQAKDVLYSGATGTARGFVGLPGLPGSIARTIDVAPMGVGYYINRLSMPQADAQKIYDDAMARLQENQTPRERAGLERRIMNIPFPTSEGIVRDYFPGLEYEAKTPAGRVAGVMGEFVGGIPGGAPIRTAKAVLGTPGAARSIMRTELAPSLGGGLASGVLGEKYAGTEYEGLARVGGGLAGAGAAAVGQARFLPSAQKEYAEMLAGDIIRQQLSDQPTRWERMRRNITGRMTPSEARAISSLEPIPGEFAPGVQPTSAQLLPFERGVRGLERQQVDKQTGALISTPASEQRRASVAALGQEAQIFPSMASQSLVAPTMADVLNLPVGTNPMGQSSAAARTAFDTIHNAFAQLKETAWNHPSIAQARYDTGAVVKAIDDAKVRMGNATYQNMPVELRRYIENISTHGVDGVPLTELQKIKSFSNDIMRNPNVLDKSGAAALTTILDDVMTNRGNVLGSHAQAAPAWDFARRATRKYYDNFGSDLMQSLAERYASGTSQAGQAVVPPQQMLDRVLGNPREALANFNELSAIPLIDRAALNSAVGDWIVGKLTNNGTKVDISNVDVNKFIRSPGNAEIVARIPGLADRLRNIASQSRTERVIGGFERVLQNPDPRVLSNFIRNNRNDLNQVFTSPEQAQYLARLERSARVLQDLGGGSITPNKLERFLENGDLFSVLHGHVAGVFARGAAGGIAAKLVGSQAPMLAGLEALGIGAGVAGAIRAPTALASRIVYGPIQKEAARILQEATVNPQLMQELMRKASIQDIMNPLAVNAWAHHLQSTVPGAASIGLRGEQQSEGRPQAPRFAGGRVGRASGGRLMRNDHAMKAAALIRAAEAAKKAHNATTEGILEQPDEAVAKALSIANKAI